MADEQTTGARPGHEDGTPGTAARGTGPDAGELTTADRLGRVARAVHSGTRDRLAPLGLTPSAARALRTLAWSDEPPRMTDLADRMRIVPRSATALVDDLEADGLVERRPAPGDRRSMRVHLTDDGRERVAAMRRARGEAAGELFSALTPQDRDELARILALLDRAADDAWCRRREPAAG